MQYAGAHSRETARDLTHTPRWPMHEFLSGIDEDTHFYQKWGESAYNIAAASIEIERGLRS